jgi:hypothetical protein
MIVARMASAGRRPGSGITHVHHDGKPIAAGIVCQDPLGGLSAAPLRFPCPEPEHCQAEAGNLRGRPDYQTFVCYLPADNFLCSATPPGDIGKSGFFFATSFATGLERI